MIVVGLVRRRQTQQVPKVKPTQFAGGLDTWGVRERRIEDEPMLTNFGIGICDL